jgi:riboflavin-specific deaminase-like protein
MKAKLPFVFSNFAVTADGNIAFASDNFVPFGSARDRERMMELRATADAIICGATTVAVTETVLGSGGENFRRQRLNNRLAEHPLRIVVSGSGSIDADAPIFKKHFSPVIVLTTERISKSKLKILRRVADQVKICGRDEINFQTAFIWLREKWNVRRLLCEGGGELHGALIRAGLADELHLTFCPIIFGGRDAPTIADGKGILNLSDAAQFKLKSMKRFENELFAVYSRQGNGI